MYEGRITSMTMADSTRQLTVFGAVCGTHYKHQKCTRQPVQCCLCVTTILDVTTCCDAIGLNIAIDVCVLGHATQESADYVLQ